MADQWYYAHQGQQSGPVSTEQLRQIAASGQLQPSDMVWKQGMAAWSPASTVEGLFGGAPGPGAPPAGPAPYPQQPGMPPQGPPGGYPVAMRFTLSNLSVGAWVMVGSLALAVVALFFKWTAGPYEYTMGLINPWLMYLAVFVYPVWMLLAGRPIHFVGGILCGGWGVITVLFWMLRMSFSLANWGMYIYLVSCVALIVGVILYKPTGWRLLR